MFYKWYRVVHIWTLRHKKQLMIGAGVFVALVLLLQIFYPSSWLLPFTKIDGIAMSGWQKKDARWELDQRYSKEKIAVYFGKADHAYRSPVPADIKLQIKNDQRVTNMQYPWYLRLVPSSILWAHATIKPAEPEYVHNAAAIKDYVSRELGQSCSVQPKNASFKAKDSKLEIISSADGGTCELGTVSSALSGAKVTITGENRITIPVKVIKPTIGDDAAKALVAQITSKLSKGAPITVGSAIQTVPAAEAYAWIDAIEQEGKLTFTFNSGRASGYLNQQIAPKVAVKPGVSKVTTHDFVETARQNGATGQTLDIDATLAQLKEYVESKRPTVAAATKPIAPTVEYTRSYSPTDVGLSALLKHYAEAHPGTFGISLIELSGKRRRAAYQDTKVFTTASTYKLFVAYSSLKRVEEGVWHWTDPIQGGRNLDVCFDDMIVKSDNACAEALLQKIGFRPITAEIQALGLKSSTFLQGNTPQTTAGDLSTFNAMLVSGQLLSQQASRDKLLNAMKRNIYRQGIPAGTSSQVADKVGFLEGLFHDAAVVYTPAGPYVLTIMSDGSNWATIADLTKQIETLRNQ
jgi:beta-lactamase class A